MKVVHVNRSGDGEAGAARSVKRLHEGLRRSGWDSEIYCLNGGSDDGITTFRRRRGPAARVRYSWRSRRIGPSRYAASRSGLPFTDDRSAFGRDVVRQMPDADIAHLHWVGGFLDWSSGLRRIGRPMVWTLRDMNPLSGGCHVDLGCGAWERSCGRCPQLASERDHDLSRRVFLRKRRALTDVDRLHVVATSRMMADRARRSPLFGRFPVHTIPLGLDLNDFGPRDPRPLREVLDVPKGADVVLFVANVVTNDAKGYSLLVEALEGLEHTRPICLLTVGSGKPSTSPPCAHVHLGPIKNDRLLASVYSTADVFVNPSLQEAFSQTTLEALACGTPVVGSETGALPELLEGGAGITVPAGRARELRQALFSVLVDKASFRNRAAAMRGAIEREYSLQAQANRYIALYESMLSSS